MNSTQKPSKGHRGPIVTNKSRLGDMAEQWVKLLSHWKGCEVFQNVGCTGATDITIKHPCLGLIEVDVKCATYSRPDPSNRPSYWHWHDKNSYRVPQGIWPVIVEPDGDIANWRVRWHPKRIPAGWEGFWDNDNRIYSTTSTKHNDL